MSISMHIQNFVKFYKNALKISSGNQKTTKIQYSPTFSKRGFNENLSLGFAINKGADQSDQPLLDPYWKVLYLNLQQAKNRMSSYSL